MVTSFVSDLVLPIVSLLPFLNRNMDQKFAVLSKGPNYVSGEGYNTLKQARDDGALVLAWGYVCPLVARYSPCVGVFNLGIPFLTCASECLSKPYSTSLESA